ncbi:hypothetical protein GCM10029978_003020 [Actinoallomurus acanthiterrae]
MIRVLLAEDQGMVRGALATLLNLEDDMEVVGEAADGDEALTVAARTRPDVALLDIEMPGRNGIDAAAALREALPGCRVIILTTFGRPGYLRSAMEAGASAFLVKDSPARELAAAIRRVLAGERVIDPALAAAALSACPTPCPPASARHSPPRPTAPPSATWRANCTCRRGRCATTCPPRSARPAPATASRPYAPPNARAGSNTATPCRDSRLR